MRLYNGAPDKELQALLDNRARLRHELNKINPNLRVTYFPMEEKFQCFEGLSEIGPWFDTEEAACMWLIKLKGDKLNVIE